jgi:hypothetical protein
LAISKMLRMLSEYVAAQPAGMLLRSSAKKPESGSAATAVVAGSTSRRRSR